MRRESLTGPPMAGALLALSACGMGLVACGGPDSTPPSLSPEARATVGTLVTDPHSPGEFFPVTVDGKPCILWMYRYDVGAHAQDSMSGLTCDWSDR